MNFREEKRHRIRESGKSTKNALKLASRLQHFLSTGKVTRQILKDLDAQFISAVSEYGEKIKKSLDQLKDYVPKSKWRDALEQIDDKWMKWLTGLKSRNCLGYSDIPTTSSKTQISMIDSVVDTESDLMRMLSAFSVSIVNSIKKSSYELPNIDEISKNVDEILAAYGARQRILMDAATEA